MLTTRFLNLPCLEIPHGDLRLLITTSVGPRVLALLVDGENIFAELPDRGVDHPSGGQFSFHGGHRLWLAPEIAEVTYLPDDDPVKVEAQGDAIRFMQRPDPRTGIQKTMGVQAESGGGFRLIHTLTNLGERPTSCAPWAITQLKPGGTAILPQAAGIPGFSPYQPNRAVVLWPYMHFNDPHLHFGDRFILVDSDRPRSARPAEETGPSSGATAPLKIGAPNPAGWIAYHLDGIVFIKYAAYDPAAEYVDLGASSQVYSGPDFIELETLGPKATLAPGQNTAHIETWRVFRDVDFDGTESGAAAMVAELGLSTP